MREWELQTVLREGRRWRVEHEACHIRQALTFWHGRTSWRLKLCHKMLPKGWIHLRHTHSHTLTESQAAPTNKHQYTHTRTHWVAHTAIKSPKQWARPRSWIFSVCVSPCSSIFLRASASLLSPRTRHEVYLVKLISFELSTGNNAKIIHRHHQYNQQSTTLQRSTLNPQLSTLYKIAPNPFNFRVKLFASFCGFVNLRPAAISGS